MNYRKLFYIPLAALLLTGCSIQQRVKRADKKFAIGEYYVAADIYKQCYSRLNTKKDRELKRRVDSGEMKVALALYPVTMQQIIDIADSGNIMPPKTTWFEPKLRSGLVIHELS